MFCIKFLVFWGVAFEGFRAGVDALLCLGWFLYCLFWYMMEGS